MNRISEDTAHVEYEHTIIQTEDPAIIDSNGESNAIKSSQADIALTPAQELKSRISFRALVESDGIAVRTSGRYGMACCPFHRDKTPSFAIYETDIYAHCFGCDWKGDIFDYVMKRVGCTFPEALEFLAKNPSLHGTKRKRAASRKGASEELYRFTDKELQEFEKSTARLCSDQWLCARIAESRKWKPATIQQLAQQRHLGWGGDALEFIYKTGIKVRKWPGKEFRWFAGQPYIWRADQIEKACKVIITEGEPDAITLIDSGLETEGIAIVAAPSASTFHLAWANLFRGKKVIICFDADEAGEKGAQRVGELLLPVALAVDAVSVKEVAR